jgi:anti-sigma factor RsiW
MNHDPAYNQLRELNWRRKLTAAEEAELRACLAANPEALEEWKTDAALGEVLDRLPEAPMPSNFTARVLQTVERETAERARAPRWSWSWRVLLPRAAVVVAVVGLSLFASQQYEVAQRARLARNVVAVLGAQPPPNPQDLADFEAIRRLNKMPPPDEELLALLK